MSEEIFSAGWDRRSSGPSAIAVAMCTFNGDRYLTEQLESIASQTRLPDSLVVVDDRSSDATVEILRDFAGSAPLPVRIVVNDENLGYRRNFEKAIGLCDGGIIALSDQDDVWHPTKVEVVSAAFEDGPDLALVFSDATVVDGARRALGYRLWEVAGFSAQSRKLVRTDRAFDALLRRNFVTGATLAFRSSYRSLLLPIAEGSDHDAWIALVLSAVGGVRAIEDSLIEYRQHGANQIGVARSSPLEKLRRGGERQRSFLRGFQNELIQLRERLSGSGAVAPGNLVALEETIEHLGARAVLPSSRTRRVGAIYRELAAGRYGRRANGFLSALRDLFS